MSGSDDLLGDLVAEARQGARGETGALELLERETEMRSLTKKSKAIIAGAAIAGLASAGGAYAYWTTTGSGTGSATVAASAGTTLTLSSGPLSGAIVPGSSNTFSIKATNLGPTALNVTNISTVVSSSDSACQALIGDFSVADVSTGVVVAVGGVDVGLGTATLVYNNSSASQNPCKGAPLTFTFNAS
jgi:hypothetical protein